MEVQGGTVVAEHDRAHGERRPEMNKSILSLTLAAAASLAMPSASAALVTLWDWQVEATFTSAAPLAPPADAVTGSVPNPSFPIAGPAPSFNNTVLRWGGDIGNGQSGLLITNPSVSSPPLLVTNG